MPTAPPPTAHRLLDQCIDQLATARNHPWQPVPDAVQAAYTLTGTGSGESALATRIARDILPYGTGNTHPGFFGWVHGTGLASGILSEMAAATINANTGGRDHGAIYLERAVIDWAKGVFDFPPAASGLLVTGTSQATIIALAAARVRVFGPKVRAQGNGGVHLTAYAGAGVHNAARKALELLGLGSDNLRLIPDAAHGIDLSLLTHAIAADRAAGATPFAIIGTAGSVDLGRFDDLGALADLAAAQSLWLHVDGAFGAWTRLADAPWRALTDGIGRADSLACDFHKWMYVPYDCGMVLIRDQAEHRAAFASRPAYLAAQTAGLGGGEPWFCDYGTDLSRGNRALKVWSAIETYGTARLGAAISDNCRMAALMGDLAGQAPMRLMAPVVSNLCVFTANAGLSPQAQSDLNTRIAQTLQLQGVAVFSTTNINGITCLRAAITNHRTRAHDVTAAMAAVRALAL
ncbi:pyridoxal phosphate-dependent decarboxylase family protein [Pseudorhodobacter ferrugineus]|uniref:pyridoxal phosphate-dependent decarboxylase family protein n=1 Tax=Pseudorhodobacter ferrugineus TaxID=77008 RepID=UPI0004203908|nr:pyridoxal-dependent decarboxylase [Pseudorhodobacter ferrugineus]